MKSNNIYHKILFALSSISGILIIFFSILIAIFIKNTYENNFYNKLTFESETVAFEINKELEKNLSVINTLSQNLSSIADPTNNTKINRQQAIDLLEKTIQDNSHVLDLYIVWEENVFDGLDSLLKEEITSDSTGRFCPFWAKDNNGKIKLGAFNFFENEKYYKNTKDEIKTLVFEPFIIRKNAQKVMKLPIVAPILYGNKFLGIIGMNISVEWLQFNLDARNIENQKIAIINKQGTIVSLSNDQAYKGKFMTELILDKQDEIYFDINNGIAFDYITDNYIIIGTPFVIGDSNESWHSIILYPNYRFKFISYLILVVFIFGGIILTIIVTIIFQKSLKTLLTPILSIETLLSKLEDGILFEDEDVNNKNQALEQINKHLISIRDIYQEIEEINENLINENYEIKVEPKNHNDKLRNSINLLINKLKTDKQKNLEKENLEKKSNWVKQGIAQLNDSIRLSSGSINELSDIIVRNIAIYMDAMLCGLFIYTENDKKEKYLEAISTYAYDLKKSYKKRFELNEGFIGTCAIERKKIYLTKIPDNYINISSGLGTTNPKSIIILPLEFENEFIGVMEIAFLRILENYEIEFTESIINNISSAIKTVKINLQTSELLEKSQKQADELAKKESELTNNLEQQKKIQKQYQIRETELNSILNAVNNTILTIEYTTKGILLNANDKFLNTMNYTLDEIKGVNVLDLVKSEREELEKVINSVANGNFVEKIMKRYTKYGEVRWLLSTYTPYYDISGEIVKILYFAFDITDSKIHADELENENRILKEELELCKIKLRQISSNKSE